MRSCRIFLILLQSFLATAEEISFQEEPVAINGSTVDIYSLIDERIPTLTGLEGNFWAGRLLTVPRDIIETGSIQMVVDFRDEPDYQGQQVIEFVMFNCLDWGIGARSIRIYAGSDLFTRHDELFTDFTVTTESCDHLVHLCVYTHTNFPVLNIEFFGSDWIHIAEMIFHDQPLPLDEDQVMVNCPSTLTIGEPELFFEECDSPIAATCGLAVGVEAILITIIFVIIQICVCKYFRRTKQRNSPSASGRATNGTSVTDSKGQTNSGVSQQYSVASVGRAGEKKKTSPVSPHKSSHNSKSTVSVDRRLPGIPQHINEYQEAQRQDTAKYDEIVGANQPADYETPINMAQDEYEEVGGGNVPKKLNSSGNSEEVLYECIGDPNTAGKSIDDDDDGEEEGEDEDGTYILPGDVATTPGDKEHAIYLKLNGNENIDKDEDA